MVIRATTRLIQVNVIVRDNHGQPVRDLKKEDFRLTDNGKPQQISIFSMDSNAMLPQADKLPANVFTNRLQQKSAVPAGVTVILIDSLNTKITDQQYAKQQVIKYLSTIRPEDHVGIYALGSGLRVLHDFTTDSSALLQQLAKYKGGNILPETPADGNSFSGDPSLQQFDNWMNGGGASGAERDFFMVNRIQGTLHAIEFIANHLASLPGRKNLIWVSGGFPLTLGFDSVSAFSVASREHRTFSTEVERTIHALNDGNVAIYPVDARGLVVDARFSAENRKVDLAPRLSMGPVVEHQQTMSVLADSTGGHAYYNTNDLAKAIRDAVDDSALTYTLGYYPNDDSFNGRFHKVEVKTPGRSGLNIRARKGYFDVAERPQDARLRKTELQDAVWSPLDSSSLGMVVQIGPTDVVHPNDLNVYMKIDPEGIGMTASGDKHDGQFDILFVQKDDRGKQFKGEENTVNFALKPETWEKISKEGFVFHQFVPRIAQATALRVVVRDASSGTLGSVTVPFDQLKL
ncbi:MAG: VWA domain-containing protein [Acidobacteriota bacterium]|nr:VWA domain-containing protein [Acidobacteriota bacterium]